ncbi:MEDS domain-containing protein [Fictibacillus norfolkensis]|uniref:MEDS domain-containing protein n=1 Tax=Fictibacillus norfolkensis TaxID=2762233 RepID=A0ABR8SMW0_9BACL|nr:MEDS domain-containing protein [Fictibacillus norfolkensis]MBD7964782.1 MEDS domain-containing protein [Fictibacillus norfolkensis]
MEGSRLNLSDVINKYDSKSVHILFVFNEVDQYVQNAANYLSDELNKGSHVLLVENDRIFPMLLDKLKETVCDQMLLNLKRENTFDFYYEQESFDPDSIFNHFKEAVSPFEEQGKRIVTWGHVEWGKDLDSNKLICYERKLEKLLKKMSVISVCAFDEDRLSIETKESLVTVHDIYINGNKIVK